MIISKNKNEDKTILGFKQKELKKNKLSLLELICLYTLKEMIKNNKKTTVCENKKEFMELDLKKFTKEYYFFGFSNEELKKTISKFNSLNLLNVKKNKYDFVSVDFLISEAVL